MSEAKLLDLPPTEIPRIAYIDVTVSEEARMAAESRGWKVEDVRLISDEIERLDAIYEGLLNGTIQADDKRLRQLDAISKTWGAHKRETREKKPVEIGVPIEKLLNFKPETGETPQLPASIKKPPRDKPKQVREKVLTGGALQNKVRALRSRGKHAEADEWIRKAEEYSKNKAVTELTPDGKRRRRVARRKP